MGLYRERRPADGRGLLACTWSRTGDDRAHRIVPDACVDLLWNGSELWIAGPDTRAYLSRRSTETITGVRFAPGMAATVLGLPTDALRDQRVDLDRVWDRPRVDQLAEALAAATGDEHAERVLSTAVLAGAGEPEPVVAAIRGLAPDTPVRALADTVGLSERQLHRRCLAAFGYGPKTLQRVLRFDRALRLARAGGRFADVAARTGYSDQAHLSREVRALAGVSLRTLVGP